MFCPRCGAPAAEPARFCTQCGHALDAAPQVPEPVFAGFWLRVGAYLIDQFILTAIYLVLAVVLGISALGMVLGAAGRAGAVAPLLGNVFLVWGIMIFAHWLYCALFESSARQATPGKLALRIKVTDLNGARISFGRASGRFFAEWLTGCTFGVGYLMVAFTKKRQALHDMIAETVVVGGEVDPARVIHAGPAPRMSGWGVAALVLLVSIAPLGVMAAIAIPAYQEYTIRTEVSEGLRIASDYKGAVQSHFEATGRWPADLTELESRFDLLKQVNGSRYVQSIEVSNGTIVITYGRNAHPKIDDYLLSLRPHAAGNGRVVWQCGNAEPPRGVEPDRDDEAPAAPASDFGVTSLVDRYMPASCRSGFAGS